MEYYLAIKKNTFDSVLVKWMNLKPVIPNEVSQREKKKLLYINTYIWNLEKWIQKLWYIYTMECYSAIKWNTFESVLMRWMDLEPFIQSVR